MTTCKCVLSKRITRDSVFYTGPSVCLRLSHVRLSLLVLADIVKHLVSLLVTYLKAFNHGLVMSV